jgi:NADH-quinone oxidoreductase subunit C
MNEGLPLINSVSAEGGASGSLEALKSALPELVASCRDSIKIEVSLGDLQVWIPRSSQRDFLSVLRKDPRCDFDMFISVTAIDWMDSREERYEVIYHLLSLSQGLRIRVRVFVPESDASLESVQDIWAGANFMEREVWDMYGVAFKGHPDLRRILMYDEFKGHPLRKDYPVQGKQPRIPLRAPEVRNTAVDMKRSELVTIGRRLSPAPSAK